MGIGYSLMPLVLFHVPLMTSMLISTAATFVLSAALWLGSQR